MLKIQTIQMNMLEENCYVVFDESKEAVVIDCGAGPRQHQAPGGD